VGLGNAQGVSLVTAIPVRKEKILLFNISAKGVLLNAESVKKY